jgi:DNA gyrase subunit B
MNADDLEDTPRAPDKRRLIQVSYKPEFEAEIEMMFSRLMGEKVEPRREFIERHAKEALNVDWHYYESFNPKKLKVQSPDSNYRGFFIGFRE